MKKMILFQAMIALIFILPSLGARAANPNLFLANEKVKPLVQRILAKNACILEIEDPPFCDTSFIQIDMTNYLFTRGSKQPVDLSELGITRWHACYLSVKTRYPQDRYTVDLLVTNRLSEFESCVICTFTAKAPSQEKIDLINADIANARAELLSFKDTPAFCKE